MNAVAPPLEPAPSAPRPDVLAALARVAWTLEPLAPHERAGLLRDEAALLVDGLLVRVARGLGAVDVALGEALDVLSAGGNGLMIAGASCLGDYARERLGVEAGTARRLVRLARALRERPLLRTAVRRGEVSARKAETILGAARGDAEAAWVERARGETVRALAAAVRAGGLAQLADPDGERRERFGVELSPEERGKVDAALALAGAELGAGARPWQCLEVVCAEYLGRHPIPPTEAERDASLPESFLAAGRDLEALKEGLEHEMRRWDFLGEPERFEAPPELDATGSLRPRTASLHTRVRELAEMRASWDALVGHLGMLVQNCGLWRHMGFASVGHYAEERLGMSGRALEQRAALERRLWALPALRRALREGRLSYEKARLVAAHADARTVADLVARAEALPCIALCRELEAGERTQMCERGDLSLLLPRPVAALLAAAIRAAREVAGTWLTTGQALARLAEHFLEVWADAAPRPRTAGQRAIARDLGWCQVPGCSRPAVHAHHVIPRSRGGPDKPWNLAPLCAGHHLHGVHAGFLRVSGQAPDALVWELPLFAA